MKAFTVVAAISIVSGLLGFASGYHTGSLDQGIKYQNKIRVLEFNLTRASDPAVRAHAEKVSRLTGRSVDQILNEGK